MSVLVNLKTNVFSGWVEAERRWEEVGWWEVMKNDKDHILENFSLFHILIFYYFLSIFIFNILQVFYIL